MFKSHLYDSINENKTITEGECRVDSGIIKIHEIEDKVEGLKYAIPVEIERETQLVIQSIGKPKLFVKSEDDTINTLITDYQLMGVKFETDGEIKFDGRSS